jgi:transcriptional regulator with PAS, ATPase and Fis domain
MSDRRPTDTEVAPSIRQATLRIRAATLEVQSGVDAGRTARVEATSFVVGSGDTADFRMTDTTVSREHLRLTLDDAGLRVKDEGSRNGTFIGAARVMHAILTADTVLRLGESTVAVRLDSGPSEIVISERSEFGGAIGVSPAMRHVFAMLERAARSDVTVLLEGESGVGKDVLSHALHVESPRAEGPFVAVDCGAIPANLIESELFGHVKGAFTGADRPREGLIAQADGGTLFLDEIGELPMDLQPKLLRVLETREVRPIGARDVQSVNVRVVAATNRKLGEAVAAGAFRKDLFYRLAVARITVPPLRDRPEDVAPLARAFLARSGAGEELPHDLAGLMATYAWPGNVRELRNVIERYALLGLRDPSGLFDASLAAASDVAGEDLSLFPLHEARRRAIDAFERAYVPRVLERAGGVMARAAELAGVARPSFYRMLERLRLRGDLPQDD